MSTKNNPGSTDCYAKAEPDEPMFILLGRDPMAPQLVEAWAHTRSLVGDDPAVVQEALDTATKMREHLSLKDRTEFPTLKVILEAFHDDRSSTDSTDRTEHTDSGDAAEQSQLVEQPVGGWHDLGEEKP